MARGRSGRKFGCVRQPAGTGLPPGRASEHSRMETGKRREEIPAAFERKGEGPVSVLIISDGQNVGVAPGTTALLRGPTGQFPAVLAGVAGQEEAEAFRRAGRFRCDDGKPCAVGTEADTLALAFVQSVGIVIDITIASPPFILSASFRGVIGRVVELFQHLVAECGDVIVDLTALTQIAGMKIGFVYMVEGEDPPEPDRCRG